MSVQLGFLKTIFVVQSTAYLFDIARRNVVTEGNISQQYIIKVFRNRLNANTSDPKRGTKLPLTLRSTTS